MVQEVDESQELPRCAFPLLADEHQDFWGFKENVIAPILTT
jgi:hypothetical protein